MLRYIFPPKHIGGTFDDPIVRSSDTEEKGVPEEVNR
jgi:hypothetical protein